MFIFSWIKNSVVGRVLIALLISGALVFGLMQYGRTLERQDVEVQQLKDFTETKRRIDNVEVSPDRDAAVSRMRSNGLIR